MPFWLGGEVHAGARDMFAKRETLAASSAEDRKHGAQDAPATLEDALACLAEQGATHRTRSNAGARFPGGGAGISCALPANVHA